MGEVLSSVWEIDEVFSSEGRNLPWLVPEVSLFSGEKKYICVSCGSVFEEESLLSVEKKNDKRKYFDGMCELFLRIQQYRNGVLFRFFIICLSCYAIIVLFTYLKEINLYSEDILVLRVVSAHAMLLPADIHLPQLTCFKAEWTANKD